jgi:osmotically-inducible protein OsmY
LLILWPARTQTQALSRPSAETLSGTHVWLSQAQQPPTPAPNPQDKAAINSNIQSNLQSAFSSDPLLEGADLQASVDDVAVTITGSVQSEGQHRRALAFASQYAQYRQIVDKIAVK